MACSGGHDGGHGYDFCREPLRRPRGPGADLLVLHDLVSQRHDLALRLVFAPQRRDGSGPVRAVNGVGNIIKNIVVGRVLDRAGSYRVVFIGMGLLVPAAQTLLTLIGGRIERIDDETAQ